jgi:hypothetical protein
VEGALPVAALVCWRGRGVGCFSAVHHVIIKATMVKVNGNMEKWLRGFRPKEFAADERYGMFLQASWVDRNVGSSPLGVLHRI